MESAPFAPAGWPETQTVTREGPIRTLGVSLVAIAAIAASLTLVRQRAEARPPEPDLVPDDQPATVDLNLEAIRSAGL